MDTFNAEIKSKGLYLNNNRRTCFKQMIRTSRNTHDAVNALTINRFARKVVRLIYIFTGKNDRKNNINLYFPL